MNGDTQAERDHKKLVEAVARATGARFSCHWNGPELIVLVERRKDAAAVLDALAAAGLIHKM